MTFDFFGGVGGLFQAHFQCCEPTNAGQNKIYKTK